VTRTTRSRRPATRTRRRTTPRVSPDVTRSLVGIGLLVVGAITLIALLLPGEGTLTTWWRDFVAPWFGTGRWLLPFLLLGAGVYLERSRAPGRGWGVTIACIAIAYIAILGIVHVLDIPDRSGGRIGAFVGGVLADLLSTPGAIVVLLAVAIGAILILLDRSLGSVVAPLGRGAREVGSALKASAVATGGEGPSAEQGPVTAGRTAKGAPKGAVSTAASPGQTEAFGPGTGGVLDEPAPRTAAAPISQTVWAGHGGGEGGSVTAGPGAGVAAGAVVAAAVGVAASDAGTEASGNGHEEDRTGADIVMEALHEISWTLPAVELLEPREPGRNGAGIDHTWNIRRIEEKLLSFQIPAKVVATNSGPVVTQYEVRPEAHVKLSRIEALADDLAMALAARTIRIEAPIPGKDVVGIEIPNQASEVVGFRPLIDETRMLESTSPLTFALGRDVSGKAYAVDLAKMPHLLVAGATGSGKSVCVNALITSILMRARPDEVRLILVDLKRVELAPYNGLPHLLQHVIVEAHEAKAVLNWAVHEMEERYKRLAARTVRNVGAYNALPDLPADERLPYIVLIVDELADLIMREGRKVEDPIVKIAQKARAVGIHLVLATQRPSVNVVTGLIKANVPSRIAFAMASMIDSRTVLDQPGAEDLIGRGDMLYQPVDLPRPVRLQGVFVSDREVTAVTKDWLDQAGGRTYYDADVFSYVEAGEDGGEGGKFAWLAKMAEDEMTVRAAELVTSTGRASTSMLQTKLKLGFARASRVIDELERYGIVGPQDPRNPASPRQVYGPDNWFRSVDDIDDEGA
jgi:S-DNA-T family DNA segregation ATPase FtsK/SpoIIIE